MAVPEFPAQLFNFCVNPAEKSRPRWLARNGEASVSYFSSSFFATSAINLGFSSARMLSTMLESVLTIGTGLQGLPCQGIPRID
jgi:hypothetical protein